MQLKQSQNTTRPANTKLVYAWRDLPNTSKLATYQIAKEGQTSTRVTLKGRKRQVLEALMRNPVMAASYCRLSDQVLSLRRDHGLDIETEMYSGDADTDRQKYGVYFLKSKVERLSDEAAK